MIGNYLDFQCCFHRAAKKLTRIWISISNFYLILRYNLVIKTAEYEYRLLLSKPLFYHGCPNTAERRYAGKFFSERKLPRIISYDVISRNQSNLLSLNFSRKCLRNKWTVNEWKRDGFENFIFFLTNPTRKPYKGVINHPAILYLRREAFLIYKVHLQIQWCVWRLIGLFPWQSWRHI